MRIIPTAALALALGVSPVLAQQSEDVHFQGGNYGTTIEGSVTGRDYHDYRLSAEAGQEMFVELTAAGGDGNGTVYFNILPPGSSGEAIHVGSMDGNSTTVDLPASGAYTIRVYLMGNDRDTGRTVDYNVDVSIQ